MAEMEIGDDAELLLPAESKGREELFAAIKSLNADNRFKTLVSRIEHRLAAVDAVNRVRANRETENTESQAWAALLAMCKQAETQGKIYQFQIT